MLLRSCCQHCCEHTPLTWSGITERAVAVLAGIALFVGVVLLLDYLERKGKL